MIWHLTWKYHVLSMAKNIRKGIFALIQVKNMFPFTTLKTPYYTLIHSHVNYCIEVWGSSVPLDIVTRLQKRAIRLFFNKPYRAHTEPLLKQAQILKVKDLYHMNILLFSHNYRNHRLPASFENCFDRVNISRATRLEYDLY